MQTFVGIDVGTSGTKAVLMTADGTVLGRASAEYPLSSPQAGWSEQAPEAWWRATEETLGHLTQQHGVMPDAIGLTGQMHGAVFLDKDGVVVRPAILWNDQRTAHECALIDEIVGATHVRAITRNPPLTGFQLPKLLWLREHEPECFARVRRVLLPKDYLRFRLTGDAATDPSDASGTGAFDVGQRRWSRDLLAALALDPALFPPVVASTTVTGVTKPGVVSPGTPVVAGAGDQAAAGIGTGAVRAGVVSVSLGTSGVVFTALDALPPHPTEQAHTFCHATGRWHAMTVMLSCGGAVRWLRDTVYPGETYDAMTAEAATVPPGAEGLTWLPYLNGERSPHNDPNATASFSGLTMRHTRAHLARAAFEGVTFGLLDGLDVLHTMGVDATQLRVTGGGATSLFWRQLLADITRVPCVTLACDEGPAYGAAILAGISVGTWPDVHAACDAVIRVRETVEPRGGVIAKAYGDAANRYRELYHHLRPWGRTA